MSKTIGIIGGGNMGEALIKGLHKKNRVLVCESNPARVKYLPKNYDVTALDLSVTVEEADIVILAVKPQDMEAVLSGMRKGGIILPVQKRHKLYISIAAGLTTSFFEKHIGGKISVVRSMPNMPAMIGEGITGLCGGHFTSLSELKVAEEIIGVLGETMIVKEAMMDALTAVSGSGPAYVFLFVEQWIKAAKKLGFKEVEAKQLVYKTLVGSAHLLEKSEFDAADLRAKVTSKGGTTQAAMDVFSSRKLDKIINDALSAATKRSEELAK
ncbi:MAG: pyrroline-5-carboxylate reductase [Candidatus Omnitrophota bacterium]